MGSRCLYGSISSSSVTMNKLPLRCPRSLRRSARSFSTSRRCAADHVRIVEVGPRDGLQNEKSTIPLDTKLELIRRLAQTGVTHMEAGSFVPPKWVPQMASTAEILETILTDPPSAPQGIAYNYLVPNTRGLESLVKIFQAKGAKNPTAYPTPPPSPQPEQSQGQGPIQTKCPRPDLLHLHRPIQPRSPRSRPRPRLSRKKTQTAALQKVWNGVNLSWN